MNGLTTNEIAGFLIVAFLLALVLSPSQAGPGHHRISFCPNLPRPRASRPAGLQALATGAPRLFFPDRLSAQLFREVKSRIVSQLTTITLPSLGGHDDVLRENFPRVVGVFGKGRSAGLKPRPCVIESGNQNLYGLREENPAGKSLNEVTHRGSSEWIAQGRRRGRAAG